MVTCLDGNKEVNYLVGFNFSLWLRWIRVAQVRWFQTLPMIQVASGMLGEDV